jgi:hypothetical protein
MVYHKVRLFETQLKEHEPKLFRMLREPQHPHAMYKLAVSERAKTARCHVRQDPWFKQAAKAACAHKSANDIDVCVQDVLATGDLGMAEAW